MVLSDPSDLKGGLDQADDLILENIIINCFGRATDNHFTCFARSNLLDS